MLLLAAAALAACNATKHLPSGAYLLTKNQVEIEKEPELPKEDQITKLELDKYIRQQPNKRFLASNGGSGPLRCCSTQPKRHSRPAV